MKYKKYELSWWEFGKNNEILSFSIERFCYYLLSLEFIEKYWSEYLDGVDGMAFPENLAHSIGESVYRYQSGDAEHLISLLSKI